MRKSAIRSRLAALVAANVVLLCMAAAPVTARDPQSSAGSHCTIRIERVAPDSNETRIVAKTCFKSYAESFRYATRGRVAVSDSLTPADVTDAMVPSGIASVVVLGADWEGPNYGGQWSVNWEASSTCTASRSWTVSYIGDYYNDKISSAKSYGGCHKFHHWEHGSFGGAVLICQPNCSSMGVMNDQTSSLSWDY